jgi:hypothetical protein
VPFINCLIKTCNHLLTKVDKNLYSPNFFTIFYSLIAFDIILIDKEVREKKCPTLAIPAAVRHTPQNPLADPQAFFAERAFQPVPLRHTRNTLP